MKKRKALGKGQQFVQEHHQGCPIPISIVPQSNDPKEVLKLIHDNK